MSPPPIRILFATPECAPLVKTGGLGDVSASLPAALARLGVDVRILLPGYTQVLDALPDATPISTIAAHGSFPSAAILAASGPHGVPLLVLDCPSLYRRPGGPYQDPQGRDWPDNVLRFGLLSRIAADLGCEASPLEWRPEVVHCNEWQTALAPVYLAYARGVRATSLITIHNLAFQGLFDPLHLSELGLPLSSFTIDGLEYYGKLSFLKGGLRYADAITTVSPTYAEEIQSDPLGFGFHGLLAARKEVLTGILNGIDTELWNPASDGMIPFRYDSRTLDAKHLNKRALQNALGLAAEDATPLFGAVSRLGHQKGSDLLIEIAPRLVAMPAQLVVQGTGDAETQRMLVSLAGQYPGRIAVRIGFNEPLAHLIEAGADSFLMPSRFEPCGMNQMFSQRYGTPPVARATGGLVDSVVDCNPLTLAEGTATGFLFREAGAADFLAAIERATAAYRDAPTWRALQRAGMARNFGWDASALRYAEIYRRIASRGPAAGRPALRPRP